MVLNKGDIYLVDFNPAKGGEVGKLRPAIILSNQAENEIFATVMMIPLSSYIEVDAYPYRVHIPKRCGLDKDSDACIYEIRALSKKRLKQKVSNLNESEIQKIKNALCEIV